MEQAQRRFEVFDGGIAWDDDRETLARFLLQCGQQKRARLHRRTRDLVAVLRVEELLERRDVRDFRAKRRDEGVVTGHLMLTLYPSEARSRSAAAKV